MDKLRLYAIVPLQPQDVSISCDYSRETYRQVGVTTERCINKIQIHEKRIKKLHGEMYQQVAIIAGRSMNKLRL